jgi:choline dehydrogenase-like flavoprotein
MGKDINHGVVDGQLRVHGVENLRVIDVSVLSSRTAASRCRCTWSVRR